MHSYFGSYTTMLLLLVVGVGFVTVAFAAARLLSPTLRSAEKQLTYECGVDPVGEGWAQTQIRYYVYAFLYLVFAVDAVFLFPWATVFAAPEFGAGALVEMVVFLGILGLGLAYAWRRGVLAWV